MRLAPALAPVIRARQHPQLGSGGLGRRMTALLLPGRFAHGRLQRRGCCLELTLARLLPSGILAAGVAHHGPLGLAIYGDAPRGQCIEGSRTVLGRRRLGAPPLLPLVTRNRRRHQPSTFALRGGEAGDAPGGPQGRKMVLRHAGCIGTGARGPRLPPLVCAELSDRG
jgi:hypothetical protein